MSEHNKQYSPYPPLLISLITIAAWFAFQTSQLLKESDNLAVMSYNQSQIFANAQKMRNQLDSLAAETAKLAQAGNPYAAQLVNGLAARGITIDPSKAPAAGDKPAQ